MSPTRYLFVFLAPALTIGGIQMGGLWTWSTVLLAFGVIPLFELFLVPDARNLDESGEVRLRGRLLYDGLLFLAVPIQYATVGHLLFTEATRPLAGAAWAGAIASTGVCCGVLGINIAHELGHRRGRAPRLMAEALLLTSLYMHWLVEHLKGHHARVSTPEDPASARLGESLYAFLLRSIAKTYVSAWQIENRRLRTIGRSPWSWRNAIVRYHLIQFAALVLAWHTFGSTATFSFLCAAAIGILLLESVNYIEHYGLTRSHDGRRYERVRPVHSWNSDHVLGRAFLFNLSRHSDHHADAARPYQVLRHFDESPQMPTGYPGMLLLALVPPLWFAVLHPRIAKLNGERTPAHA